MLRAVCAVLVLLVAASVIRAENAKVSEARAWSEGLHKYAEACAKDNKVDFDAFVKSKKDGKVEEKYGCVYSCILEKGSVLSADGKFTLPAFIPATGVQCVDRNAGPIKDNCGKAYQAQICWENAKKAYKALKGAAR